MLYKIATSMKWDVLASPAADPREAADAKDVLINPPDHDILLGCYSSVTRHTSDHSPVSWMILLLQGHGTTPGIHVGEHCFDLSYYLELQREHFYGPGSDKVCLAHP